MVESLEVISLYTHTQTTCNPSFVLLNYPHLSPLSVSHLFQVEGAFREFVFRELSAVAGAITITCLMVCLLLIYHQACL